jgi:hypothetical protein
MGCGSIIRGFKSRRSPFRARTLKLLHNFDCLLFDCYDFIYIP